MPPYLGSGYAKDIELHPEMELKIVDCKFRDDCIVKYPTASHPLQFGVFLPDEHTYISGGGIQRENEVRYFQSLRALGIDIHMSPDLLGTFFPGQDGGIPPELKLLAKGEDWQTLVNPAMTPPVRFLTQQIWLYRT